MGSCWVPLNLIPVSPQARADAWHCSVGSAECFPTSCPLAFKLTLMLLVVGATPLQLVLRLMLLPDNFSGLGQVLLVSRQSTLWLMLMPNIGWWVLPNFVPICPQAHAEHWLVGAAQPRTNLSSGSCRTLVGGCCPTSSQFGGKGSRRER